MHIPGSYRIARKFGGDLNLAVWRLKHEPPNLIPQILCHDVIDVGVWERFRTLVKINKMALYRYFAREAPGYPTKVSSLSRKECEAANASVKDRSCHTCMN